MQGFELDLDAYQVIFREGDPSEDLYYLKSGKVIVCTITGTQVKAISRIGSGEFIGELSFFDGCLRSSYVVTLEKCKLFQIPKKDISTQLPNWFNEVGNALTKKIRLLDQVIQESNLRKSNSEENKPLSIEEQRKIYGLLTN